MYVKTPAFLREWVVDWRLSSQQSATTWRERFVITSSRNRQSLRPRKSGGSQTTLTSLAAFAYINGQIMANAP